MTDTRPPRPQQRALSWGDHWILPVGDSPSPNFIKVGHVLTKDEVRSRAEKRRLDPSGSLDDVEANLIRGYLDCLVYHRANSTGVYGTYHRRQVWPIRVELFRALKRGGYDPRNLNPRWHAEYAKAYAEWRAMETGDADPRRPFAEFLREVEQLVRVAVADRMPAQTYLGYNRSGDREIVMRITTWDAECAAIASLERHGYKARHGVENSIYVWDRSESKDDVSRETSVTQ